MALPQTAETILRRKIKETVYVDDIALRLQKSGRLEEELVHAGCRDYLRFLFLLLTYPNQVIVPTKLMDLFWHEHILDTRNYVRDCRLLLDHVTADPFIHHDPRLLPGTPEHVAGVDRRNRLYSEHFDEKPCYIDGDEEAGCGGTCA